MGIIKGLQDSYRIAIKDLMEFERNRIGLMFLFLMPFFMLLMTGFIFPTGNSYTNVPIAMVDLDHSNASMQFFAQLEAANNMTTPSPMLLQSAATIDNATTLVRQGQIYGAIIIPAGILKRCGDRENKQTSPCYRITASRRYR